MTEKRSSDINANEPNNSNNLAVHFSSLTKSCKVFSPKRFTRAFFAAFCHLPEPCRKRRDTPCVNAKRRQDFSCRQAVSAVTFPGNRKASVVRSSLPECFSEFVRWIIHRVLLRSRLLQQCPGQGCSSQVPALHMAVSNRALPPSLYCIYQTISRQQQLHPAYCNNKQSSYKNNRSCC